MSEVASTQVPTTSPGAYLKSRLGSLLAFLPLSIWTFDHIWSNLSAFKGEQEWQKSVTSYAHPLSHVLTLVVVLLPLVIHTLWGIKRLFSAKPNNLKYNTFANLKYILQRASAVGVLFFLAAHIFKAMLEPRLFKGHAETFQDIATQMHHHTPTLIVYILGTLGVAYHLSNGLYSFAMSWGIAITRKALKRIEVLSLIVFVTLLGMSWAVLFALFQAGSQYPAPTH